MSIAEDLQHRDLELPDAETKSLLDEIDVVRKRRRVAGCRSLVILSAKILLGVTYLAMAVYILSISTHRCGPSLLGNESTCRPGDSIPGEADDLLTRQ